MTVGISDGAADGLLTDLLTTAWVQLHTGAPGAAGTSNVAAETTRQQMTPTTPSGGATGNDADLVWENVAGTETYRFASLWTDETDGIFLASSQLDAPVPIAAGSTFTMDAGDLDVTLSPVAA